MLIGLLKCENFIDWFVHVDVGEPLTSEEQEEKERLLEEVSVLHIVC